MRNFDNWDNYTVEDKPFYGRFTFYKLHTTEKVEITDESGTPINNPILSDAYGRTSQQVFLPPEDVTVVLEKYIGGGDMSENPDDVSAWSEVRSFDNINQEYIPEINSNDHMVVVGTTEDLTDYTQYDKEYVMVLGYYEIGDMPPAFYHLELNSITTPDGGSIIRSDPTHIWRLITPQILDIRIFGVFPAETAASTEGFDSQFRNAFSFANTKGISVYMPKVYNRGYYAFNGGDHLIAGTLYVDNGTVLSGKSGTISELTVGKIEGGAAGFLERNEYNTGKLRLNVKSARSSWLADWNQNDVALKPTEEFIIDSQILRSPFTISDLQRVYIEQPNFNPAGRITFSRIIDFESPGRISLDAPISFQYMTEIKDSWWALTSSNHKLSTTNVDIAANCTMYLDDFLYVENFCIFQYLNGVRTFNLDGRTYNASVNDRFDSCTFLNGEIYNLHLTGTVTLRNIKGSVYTNPAAAWTDVSVEDSYIAGSLPYNITGDVYIKSSSFISSFIAGSSLPAFHGNSCVIRDSIFNGYLVQVPYNAVITGCTFDMNDQGAYSNINVYANSTNGYVSCTFSDNVLNGSKVTLMQMSAQWLITVVGAVFVGNSITNSRDGTNFIKWTNIAPSGHTYSYRNNDGPNVLQQDSYTTVWKNVPMWHNDGSTPPSVPYIEYTDPINIFHMGGIPIITGYSTTVLPNGGVISVPTYSQSDDTNTFARQSRLVGLTIADFNLFCFTPNDFVSKYITLSVSVQKREGQDNKKTLATGINTNSVGIPANLSLPAYTTGNPSADSAAGVPVPDASEDLVLQVSLTDVRTIS